MIEYDARRWATHLFAIRGSVAPKIAWRVMLHVGWAFAVVVLHRRVYAIEVPATVHALIGVALGLLLVFRTNASYDRFWEGRKAWGNIVNQTRNLARSTRAFLDARSLLLASIVNWTAAFPFAAMHALRGSSGLGMAATRLPPGDVAEVLAARHVPLAVAARISQLLAAARGAGELTDRMTIMIDNNVHLLIDDLGTCERIRKTPLPFAYVVHLRRALLLYLITLPFALVGAYGWSTALYTLLIAYVLLGIEEIGVEIENPFGTDSNDLPLEDICTTIDGDLRTFLDPAGPADPRQP